MYAAELHSIVSDEVLKAVHGRARECLMVVDDQGDIVYANEKASQTLGLIDDSRKTANCFSLFRFSFAEDMSPLTIESLPFTATVKQQKTVDNRIIGIKVANGSFLWVAMSCSPLELSGKTFAQISFFEVTAIMEKKQHLQEREHQLNELLKSIDDIVFEVSATGVLLNCWVNDTDHLFYNPSQFMGKNLIELFPGELGHAFVSLITASLKERKTLSMDYQAPENLEREFWYRMQVRPIYTSEKKVAVVITDITNRRKTEEEVRINQQKFNQAFLHSGIGMALVSKEGQCININKTLTNILGYSLDEMSGMYCSDYTHPDDLQLTLQHMDKLKRLELESYTIEKRYIHKKGYHIWCLLTMSAVTDDKGTPLFFIAQIQDVTLYKKYVAALQRKNGQLEIATLDLETKIRQLEEFNQIVAHNLRGPAGNIQMLVAEIEQAKKEEDRKEYLQLLQASSDGLIETLQELIEILEIRANKLLPYEACDFEQLYKKTIRQFAAEIYSKGAVIDTRFEVRTINCSKIYLESIMHNLISNALKYVSQERAPHIRIRTYQDQEKIWLSVEDNGLGIDLVKYGDYIFKFRKTFHSGFDSKGIGLFMTRHQIEALGGKITVESTPEQGSTFYVCFNPQ